MLKKELSAYIDKVAEELINDKPEEYEIGETDCGYYNNGVGIACYGKEPVYDEAQAREDAKAEIIRDLEIMAGLRKEPANEYVEDMIAECPSLVKMLRKGIENG